MDDFARIGKLQESRLFARSFTPQYALIIDFLVGLRTLCIAFRRLDREFYEEWAAKFYKASIAINKRSELLDEVSELIEQV